MINVLIGLKIYENDKIMERMNIVYLLLDGKDFNIGNINTEDFGCQDEIVTVIDKCKTVDKVEIKYHLNSIFSTPNFKILSVVSCPNNSNTDMKEINKIKSYWCTEYKLAGYNENNSLKLSIYELSKNINRENFNAFTRSRTYIDVLCEETMMYLDKYKTQKEKNDKLIKGIVELEKIMTEKKNKYAETIEQNSQLLNTIRKYKGIEDKYDALKLKYDALNTRYEVVLRDYNDTKEQIEKYRPIVNKMKSVVGSSGSDEIDAKLYRYICGTCNNVTVEQIIDKLKAK